MKLPAVPAGVGVALIVGAAVAFYVWRKGSVQAAASGVGAAAVQAAGGAVSGAVGALGESAGLPLPTDTTTDAAVARWLIDTQGYWVASQWAGVPALWAALSLPAGSGHPPLLGTELAKAFPVRTLTTGDFTRTDHDTSSVDLPSWAKPDAPAPSDPTYWGIAIP